MEGRRGFVVSLAIVFCIVFIGLIVYWVVFSDDEKNVGKMSFSGSALFIEMADDVEEMNKEDEEETGWDGWSDPKSPTSPLNPTNPVGIFRPLP